MTWLIQLDVTVSTRKVCVVVHTVLWVCTCWIAAGWFGRWVMGVAGSSLLSLTLRRWIPVMRRLSLATGLVSDPGPCSPRALHCFSATVHVRCAFDSHCNHHPHTSPRLAPGSARLWGGLLNLWLWWQGAATPVYAYSVFHGSPFYSFDPIDMSLMLSLLRYVELSSRVIKSFWQSYVQT